MMVTPRVNKGYGWRYSIPDFRDHKYAVSENRMRGTDSLPSTVDLSPFCPVAMDQGDLGSCVAHSVTAVMRADRKIQKLPDLMLSRLQLYYDGRVVEGTVNEDSGLEVRDAIKVAAATGAASEADWPYDIRKYTEKPPSSVYAEAKQNEALKYQAVSQRIVDIKSALTDGHPVVIGISVYDSFESDAVARSGAIPMPAPAETMIGGHCMYLHGYDDKVDASRARGRNSWGTDWGSGGDFTIPWAYLTNEDLSGDFWVITSVGAAT